MESIVSTLLMILGVYLLIGILFAIVFLWRGVHQVDPNTKGAGWVFKLLIFPGMVVFWVIFLQKWLQQKGS